MLELRHLDNCVARNEFCGGGGQGQGIQAFSETVIFKLRSAGWGKRRRMCKDPDLEKPGSKREKQNSSTFWRVNKGQVW